MTIKNKIGAPYGKRRIGKIVSTGQTKSCVGKSVGATLRKPGQVIVSSAQIKPDFNDADQRKWQKRMRELTFGQTIRAYRLSEEWSLTDTAEKLEISKQQLSDYEHGRKLPSIGKAYQMAETLGMMPAGAVLQIINELLQREEIEIRVQLAG